MKVRSYYPFTMTIDGEEVVLRIKRMTMDDWFDFDACFTKVGQPTILRFASRRPEGPEQAKNEQDQYVVSFEEICRRCLEDLSPERRAEYEAAVDVDETEARAFLIDVFDRYVTVERGLTEETVDGKEVSVTAGPDFLRIFGARRDVLGQVLAAVRTENTLDARQKKVSPSPVASSPSSTARKGRGRKRATIVWHAGTAGSAANEAATPTPAGRSGSTSTSSSARVRSVS